MITPQLHHTPVSTPTEALWKDALSENQITEGASDISRAGTKGGHPRAVLPPKELLCPPLSFLSPPLLNVIDFESETNKTVNIRKRLHALASVSYCTAKCWPLKFVCNYIHLTSDWFCVNVHKQEDSRLF